MKAFIEIKEGRDKNSHKEKDITLYFGHTYAVVGNTGSGKSQLIEDIASFSKGDSITQRKVTASIPIDLESGIAHLSQNMTFVADYKVADFFKMRFTCQGKFSEKYQEVIEIANTLTGDQIQADDYLMKLSGGQTRALMIADVLLNEEAVILLIDEIENAGIDKLKAINLLNAQGKLVLIITHQPSLALMGEYRLYMQEGGIKGCIKRTEEEYVLLQKLQLMEQGMEQFTQKLRKGESLSESLLEQYLPHFAI